MRKLWILAVAMTILAMLIMDCNDWDMDRSGFAATAQASQGTMAVLDRTAIFETVEARPTATPER